MQLGGEKGTAEKKVSTNKENWEKKKEREAEERKRANQIKRIEEEIYRLEEERSALEEKLAKPEEYGAEIASGELYKAYETVKNKIAEQELLWAELVD